MLIPWQDPSRPERRPAVTVAGRSLERRHLYEAATAMADRIAEYPVVAVHATATLETVVAFLGCLRAGVPAVPVPADAGPRERDHILSDSGAQVWIGAPQNGATWGLGLPTITVDLDRRSDEYHAEPDPDATAMIMYTSGTTGEPKGVVMSRGAIAACLDGLADVWRWTADDMLVHGLPLFHVHGLVLGVFGPLRTGGTLWHTGRPTPQGYAEGASAGGSLFFGVPTVWSRIAADPDAALALAGARLLVSGSASLPGPVARRLEELTGQIPVERYGMTETLIAIAARADEPRRVGWVGRPIDGVHARIVDDAGVPVPADGESVGDLEIRGRTLFEGYFHRPEATAAACTPDRWFRTGDVACVDANGWYRIVGRKSSDLIKSGGYRVGAGEIESALLDHPGVSDAAVVGVPDDDLGQRIVAYVIADGVTEDELVAHVGAVLSAHKRPREVRFVDVLPRNEMGKVLKAELTAR